MSLEDGVKICAKLCTKIYVWDEVNNLGRFLKAISKLSLT